MEASWKEQVSLLRRSGWIHKDTKPEPISVPPRFWTVSGVRIRPGLCVTCCLNNHHHWSEESCAEYSDVIQLRGRVSSAGDASKIASTWVAEGKRSRLYLILVGEEGRVEHCALYDPTYQTNMEIRRRWRRTGSWTLGRWVYEERNPRTRDPGYKTIAQVWRWAPSTHPGIGLAESHQDMMFRLKGEGEPSSTPFRVSFQDPTFKHTSEWDFPTLKEAQEAVERNVRIFGEPPVYP